MVRTNIIIIIIIIIRKHGIQFSVKQKKKTQSVINISVRAVPFFVINTSRRVSNSQQEEQAQLTGHEFEVAPQKPDLKLKTVSVWSDDVCCAFLFLLKEEFDIFTDTFEQIHPVLVAAEFAGANANWGQR